MRWPNVDRVEAPPSSTLRALRRAQDAMFFTGKIATQLDAQSIHRPPGYEIPVYG